MTLIHMAYVGGSYKSNCDEIGIGDWLLNVKYCWKLVKGYIAHSCINACLLVVPCYLQYQ